MIKDLGSRAVIGSYYQALDAGTGLSWAEKVSNYFRSDQASERYAWLDQVPPLRAFVGGLQPKAFSENGIDIANLAFESSFTADREDFERDKSSQLQMKATDMAKRVNAHWPSLLSTLILNGASHLCYDGQYFFDDDHLQGKSGSQSNKISSNISDIATASHGTTTAPAAAEMTGSILAGIKQIVSIKDDEGEPLNEGANQFMVMVPINLYDSALAASTMKYLASGEQNLLGDNTAYKVEIVSNVRLTWTDTFAVFRTDNMFKPFIRQEEIPPEMAYLGEDSEYYTLNQKHLFKVYTRRNVGFGLWQGACQVTLI